MRVKNFANFFVLVVFIVASIIVGLSYSLSVLKEETIKTHLKISQIHSKNFLDFLEQTSSNIEFLTRNISTLLNLDDNDEILEKELKTLLKSNLYIRSISLLDSSNKIVISTNKKNLQKSINTSNFYPKPLFNDKILRVSAPFKGRDLDDYLELDENSGDHNGLTFFVVSRKVKIDSRSYNILITINSDFFINRFIQELDESSGYIELIRADGVLILTNDTQKKLGSIYTNNNFFKKLVESYQYSGVLESGNEKYIVSYIASNNYPFVVGVKLKYDSNLQGWNQKRYDFFLINISVVLASIILALILIFKYSRQKNKELVIHKKKIENQKRFKLIFKKSDLVIILVNSEGLVIDLNEKALSWCGLSGDSAKQREVWELFNWSVHDKIWLKESILYDKRRDGRKELTLLDEKSNQKSLDMIFSSFEFGDKKEIVLIGNDITQRKFDEYRLRQAYIVFNNTKDGIIITDKDANILNVNSAFCKITGYDADEVINKNPKILKSSYHDKEFYKSMWSSLERYSYWQGEIINKKRSGELFNEYLTITIVFDEKGEIKNYIGLFSDISLQKEQEKELKKKEKLLYQQAKMASMGEMLGNIAHQWRQPLSAISTAASGMKLQKEMEILSDDFFVDSCDSIVKNSKYLSDTIEDFRDFYKKDKQMDLFDIYETIIETSKIIEANFKNKDIEVIFKRVEEIKIRGVQNEFKQAVINILNNARDVLIEKQDVDNRYVFIEVFIEDERACVNIYDSAGGIEEEIIDKIFEPYFTTKHQSVGTGIGLYMVQEIIQKSLNGEVNVENIDYKHEKKSLRGACFSIKLPLF